MSIQGTYCVLIIKIEMIATQKCMLLELVIFSWQFCTKINIPIVHCCHRTQFLLVIIL